MQKIEQLAGANGKRGMLIVSNSGKKTCVDWMVYDKDGKFITGGDGPAYETEKAEPHIEAARASLKEALK